MDTEYIHNLRQKLQERMIRLESTGFETYHPSLKQFWGFLNNYPILVGILADSACRCPSAEKDAERIVNDGVPLDPESEVESAAIAFFVIKKCVESDKRMPEADVGRLYGSMVKKFNDALEYFNRIFVEPLCVYLSENLDDRGAILALLRRYKHKCEWFQRDKLFKLWESDTGKGENNLKYHLFEYLHDQGFVDFVIEPSSASGEADLVGAQGNEPLVAEAKIFNPERSKGKTYIVKGFNQIYTYTCDHNQPFGYLIIYKTCEENLSFRLAEQKQSTPFAVYAGKTIFLITIDIFPYEDTASKRGAAKAITITEQDLIHEIQESA